MQVFAEPTDESHPINYAKTTLMTTQKEGHRVVIMREGHTDDECRHRYSPIYRYLENIMIICKSK